MCFQSRWLWDHVNTVFGFGLLAHPPMQHRQPLSTAQGSGSAGTVVNPSPSESLCFWALHIYFNSLRTMWQLKQKMQALHRTLWRSKCTRCWVFTCRNRSTWRATETDVCVRFQHSPECFAGVLLGIFVSLQSMPLNIHTSMLFSFKDKDWHLL